LAGAEVAVAAIAGIDELAFRVVIAFDDQGSCGLLLIGIGDVRVGVVVVLVGLQLLNVLWQEFLLWCFCREDVDDFFLGDDWRCCGV